MPLPMSLIQGLMAQLDENGNLKLNVQDQAPLKDLQLPPDTPARTGLQYSPTQMDLPSMSMPAQQALSDKYSQFPTFNPGFGTRLVASMAGGGDAYFGGARKGLETGQAYLRAPYQEKVEKFQSEATPLMYKAGVESDNFKRALERAKLQSETGTANTKGMVDVSNANSRILQEDTRRANAQTAAQQANIRNFMANQPDQVFRETAGRPGVPNEVVGFDKKSREVNRTGVAGQGKWRSLEDLKGLVTHRYKELGNMLRDIPQRDVFSAIDNTLRNEGLRNPQIYGKFFGKDGYILPPSELKKFTNPDDIEMIRNLFNTAVVKSKEAITKSKNLKQGIVNPNQIIDTPGGNKILNPGDDDVPNDEEEQ